MALKPQDIEDRFVERELDYIKFVEHDIDKQLHAYYDPDERNKVRVTLDAYRWNFRGVASKVVGLYFDHWNILVQKSIDGQKVDLTLSPKES